MSDLRSEAPGIRPAPCHPAWVLAGLYLFGIGFGFVEAAVVVDLRAILGPVVDRIVGSFSEDRFPMIPFDRVAQDDPAAARLLRIEVAREAATMIMLAGVGMAAGRSFLGRFSGFIVGFGIWDLTYYLFLKLLTGWPASLWTWDVLFLIPVPWAAPCWRRRSWPRRWSWRARSCSWRKRRAGRSGSRDGTGWRSSRADSA